MANSKACTFIKTILPQRRAQFKQVSKQLSISQKFIYVHNTFHGNIIANMNFLVSWSYMIKENGYVYWDLFSNRENTPKTLLD